MSVLPKISPISPVLKHRSFDHGDYLFELNTTVFGPWLMFRAVAANWYRAILWPECARPNARSGYSPRAGAGAPISTPLRWAELRRPIDPDVFTIGPIFKRLDRFGDLFAAMWRNSQDIRAFWAGLHTRVNGK
jgi:hypothetical protein